MKRFAIVLSTLCVLVGGGVARAGWGSITYGGYQPWWNVFAHRPCLTCEEERLQRFWHDYYDALQHYYCALDHIDWVAYYKNHGYQINAACGGGAYGCGPGGPGGCQRIQFAPVFVSPQMQWAVPNGCLNGPPCGPAMPPYMH
jgi:hypothetical protein